MIQSVWRFLKRWRRIPFGPVTLAFKFERTPKVTRGTLSTTRFMRPDSGGETLHQGTERGSVNAVSPEVLQSELGFAVIVGVGPGFGYALARNVAAAGMDVVLICRNARSLEWLVDEIIASGRHATSMGLDATHEAQVAAAFATIVGRYGVPSLVVYSIQEFGRESTTDVDLAAFERAWRHNCQGAFLVGRAAARLMKPRGNGTIIFVGSTSSILARAQHLNLAVGKFGQRALAQVMSRELWKFGVHVAHLLIDADIAEKVRINPAYPQADPNHIADAILFLHRQSSSAWTSEMDLRPFNEAFWEHC